MTGLAQRLRARLSRLTPGQLLLVGWLGFMAYAWPGFMSFDSIYQLQESRSGHFSDGHPPMMAELWRIVEIFIAGPLGMLIIQSVTFLAGIFLIFRRRMSDRAAAIAASLFLWFPPIGSVIAVIWKDSQMTAWIVLGVALVTADRRRTKLFGLLAILIGTGMRHNALVMTFPLIGLLFVWDPRHGFFKRYAIAIAAWVVVTMGARVVTSALTDEQRHIWHNSLALCDITSTLKYVTPDIPDAELQTIFAGTSVIPERGLHERTRVVSPAGSYVDNLWWNAYSMFRIPKTDAERAAMVKAWRTIVFGHVPEYLTYRWEVYRRLLGLTAEAPASPQYTWFVDVQSPLYTPIRIHHDATGSHFQDVSRSLAHWVGRTVVFRIPVFLVLSFLLLPLCARDRESFAWLVSGITGEAVLFLLTPTTDWRYSYWMVLAVCLSVVMLVARRMRPAPQTG